MLPYKSGRVASLVALLLATSCQTPSKQRNSLAAGSFAAGAVIGAASAPKDERQDQHAVYWGAILGLGAAVAGNFLYSDETNQALLEKENQRLKAEMDLFQAGNKILIDQGSGKFKNPVGETEIRGRKAHWKIYKIDRWTKEGSDRLYHQDQMVEITPIESGK